MINQINIEKWIRSQDQGNIFKILQTTVTTGTL